MPAYRANVTDKQQSDIESQVYEGGVPVFQDGKTIEIPKGFRTSPERTSNAGVTYRNNAGVIMPHDDRPDLWQNELTGRRV